MTEDRAKRINLHAIITASFGVLLTASLSYGAALQQNTFIAVVAAGSCIGSIAFLFWWPPRAVRREAEWMALYQQFQQLDRNDDDDDDDDDEDEGATGG